MAYSTKLSLSYDFNKNHSIGASFLNNINGKNNVEVDYFKGYAQVYSYSLPSKLLNFYYTGQIGKLNIDFNTDYFFNKGRNNTTQTEEATNSENRIIHSNPLRTCKL